MWPNKNSRSGLVQIGAALAVWSALGAAVLLLLGAPVARAELKVGDRFPALDHVPLDGVPPALAGQIVLVDFWASWCAPCKESFPAYARIHADYAPRGVVILAVSIDQNAGAYAAFVRRHAPAFAVVRDKEQTLVRTVAVPAMPTCYLVDRTGRVRRVEQGFHGAESERELRAALENLLHESPSAP